MKKKIVWVFILLVLVIQFFQIDKTSLPSANAGFFQKYKADADVTNILERACNDCHSNETKYPWYTYVQPLGWWINHHIVEGREHLNFSDFTTRKIASQNHKFEEIIEVVKEAEMPLPSYTWLGMHPEARLTKDEKSALTSWAQMQMDLIANSYPPDSLKRNSKK
ncbi:MAG: heme-binding domain-containing protein [Saprospiraceae bacterium]|nr:heme-binding domain-containing protein [Saprospiraceae bacterium]